MIAANGVTARYLSSKVSLHPPGGPHPERWDRIVEIAAEHDFTLRPKRTHKHWRSSSPRRRPPTRSLPRSVLAVIKLLGAGEYTAELPGEAAPGHFGLAVKDYAHSTAPNRRYTDLLTQRLLKAAIEQRLHHTAGPTGRSGDSLLERRERRQQSRAADRQIGGSASPAIEDRGAVRCHRHRCGSERDLGAAPHGADRRETGPGVRGRRRRRPGRVQLISVDVGLGFIDFERVTDPLEAHPRAILMARATSMAAMTKESMLSMPMTSLASLEYGMASWARTRSRW